MSTYKYHKIRSTHDKHLLFDMIDNLRENEVLIVSDWKMKMLLLEYRESMHAFFGKRGIPWHGNVFIRNRLDSEKTKTKDGVFSAVQSDKVVQYMDTLVDNATEDGHAVASILEYHIRVC